MTAMDAYARLLDAFAPIADIQDTLLLLDWDANAMMPVGAAPRRALMVASLRGIVRERLVSQALGDLLEAADAEGSDDPWRSANIQEMDRLRRHAMAVPPDLDAALTRAEGEAYILWRDCRSRGDLATFLPVFARIVALVREVADAKAAALGVGPHEALIDAWEPGLRHSTLNPVLDRMVDGLVRLLPEVQACQAETGEPLPFPPASPSALDTSLRDLLRAVGFDFARGVALPSANAIFNGPADDLRLTWIAGDEDVAAAVTSTLHEGGHALFEQNRPADRVRQPAGRPRSGAIHEGFALMLEGEIGGSDAGLSFLSDRLGRLYGHDGPAWAPDNLRRWQTRISVGDRRIAADALTYPLHIVHRVRLEAALIDGQLSPADLPDAWSQTLSDLLPLEQRPPATSCLQDPHWCIGYWGYFQSYALGAVIAAQLRTAALALVPGLDDAVARGDFSPLRSWLTRDVFPAALIHGPEGMLRSLTGRGLDPSVFAEGLRVRLLASS